MSKMTKDYCLVKNLRDTGVDLSQARRLSHYLYFCTEAAAQSAMTELSRLGMDVVVRLGADGLNWLALARHTLMVEEKSLDDLREQLETIADLFGGEYDGWELDVAPPHN